MATLAKLTTVGVDNVKGLGGKRAEALAKSDIRNVADLLHHVPHRYVDRSTRTSIARTPVGSEVTVIAEVRKVSTRRPRRNLGIVEAVVADETGTIKAVWFNQMYRGRQLNEGSVVALSGVVENFRGALQMKSPAVDVLDSKTESLEVGRVVPIHSSVGPVSPGIMRRAIHNALKRSRPIDDTVPVEMLAIHGLKGRDQAFADVHFPEDPDETDSALNRLIYDEFFRLEVALAIQKRKQTIESNGVAHQPTGDLVGRFIDGLPYRLTEAQMRVLAEIDKDLRQPHPMHRLLQGEVGSGKTVVAIASMLSVIESGYQTAVMAPTEVLAEQHFYGIIDLLGLTGLSPDLEGLGSELGMDSLFGSEGPAVHVALLTGSQNQTNYKSPMSRQELLADVLSGQIDILIGTHALIQEGVDFAMLGAAVIDEQHRFGVAQRVLLKEKGARAEPDLLIMTATPIPRTISMTLYGDLDLSTINELPPGRTPIETRLASRSEEAGVWDLVREQVSAGRQAFVVCPLVEDSPKVEAASATAEHARINSLMPDLNVGLIHGQMRSADKESAMRMFRDRQIDVLVATTVIEVGIDVPNATVMVIEDADRFGLSQLHQLRGRVGRGEHRGICVLLADPASEDAEQRLAAMVSTTDGEVLAQEDLRIRGQGTVFGTRQSGIGDLKLGNVVEHVQLLRAARRDAFGLVDSDPQLSHHGELAAEVRAMLGDRVEWLFVS